MNNCLTIPDLEKILRLSRASVYRLVASGKLPRLTGIRCIRVSRWALNVYLAGRQGLAVRVPGSEGPVHEVRVCHQAGGLGRTRGPQKRVEAGQDPNRHGLAGGHE